MSRNLYDHIFEQHIYVQRDIDLKLAVIRDSFLRSERPVRWVSLQSSHGCGSTLLLERLRRLKTGEGKEEPLRIFVSGKVSRMSDLAPLAAELYVLQMSARKSLRGWLRSSLQEARRRLKNASWARLFSSALFVIACLMFACIVVGADEFAKSSEAEITTFNGWRSFFFSYLPANWRKLPVWFLIGSLMGLPLSIAAVYLTRNGLLPAPPDPEAPSKSQIAELNTYAGLQRALFDLCNRKKHVILLVDDASQLPTIEQDFLRKLSGSEVRDSLKKKGCKFLIVTVDPPYMNRQETLDKDMHSAFEVLKVPYFEMVELQSIADSQLQASESQSEEDRKNLLEQAREDVRVLFAAQNQKLVNDAGTKFQDSDIAGEFTPAKLLVYRIARSDNSISKTALIRWLNIFQGEDHLKTFQITKSETDQGLVIGLAKSDLVDRKGETIIFDTQFNEALRQWLKQHAPYLLQQVHYYWFKNFLNPIASAAPASPDISRLTSAERDSFKRGVRQAIQLDSLNAVPSVLAQAPGLDSHERQQLCDEASRLLLPAIALARSEGDFEKVYMLARNAVEWLRASDASRQITLLQPIADQLWRTCLLSGEPTARKQLDKLADDFPKIAQQSFWRIYRAFDDLRRATLASDDLSNEAEPTDPDLLNVLRLTVVLQKIRQHHGFLSPAFADKELSIPEAISGSGSIAEIDLRELHVLTLNARGDAEALPRALQEWKRCLYEKKIPDEYLGDKALYMYQEARYWHFLTYTLQLGLKRIADLPNEDQKASKDKLVEQLTGLLLPTHGPVKISTDSLLAKTKHAYEQTRALLVLIGWRGLLIRSSFSLGRFLAEQQAEESNTEKWEWDKLFAQVVQLEKELGWMVYTPGAHRIRWAQIDRRDKEHSIEDSYNLYRSVIKGKYPTKVIIEWHQRTALLLNNYGRDEDDKKRSAELHEEWANVLSAYPAAAPFWTFKKLAHEQAHALNLAAQARRKLEDFATAEKLLNQADTLINAPSTELVLTSTDSELRELYIDLRMQRAWLLDDQGNASEYSRMLRDIWRLLRFDDKVTANALGSLLMIEAEAGVLNKQWPLAENHPPNVDPDNDALSLPSQWFDGPRSFEIQYLLDFRFRQLVRLICDERDPTPSDFKRAAENDWRDQEKFGETALHFASTGLEFIHSPALEALMIGLLEAVRVYFQVKRVDRRELEALRLLMNYKTGANKYRSDYIKVLIEFQSLEKREKQVRELSEESNWHSVAIWAYTHFGLLGDQRLINNVVLRTKETIDQLNARHERVAETLQTARRNYHEGQIDVCLQALETLRPLNQKFVLIEEILALDLWLTCKRASGDTQTEEFNQRSAQLREGIIQYIKQFSEIIPERQVQTLALDLLMDLQQAAKRLVGK